MLTGLFTTQSAYAATISLSVSGSITTTALPTSASGTTAVSDTNTTNISITTDNTTGYTLSLKSSSETAPALTGTTNNSNTIPSISTETATLDNFASGTWGYKPTKKVSGVWTNLTVIHGDTDYTSGYYLPGPTTTADVIDVTDAANSTANEYNIALGTKVSTNTAIDSYTGAFVVIAVTNEPLGITVTYDAQGGSFSGGNTTNKMVYSEPEETTTPTVTVNGSTTTSTSASGTKKTSISDTSQYANSSSYYQDLTLDTTASGPYTLTIYYATESVSYDWICVFDGTSYTPGSGDGCTDSSAVAPKTNTGGTTSGNKIGGPSSGKTAYAATATFSVASKTARVYFRSDGSVNSYGFWAVFTGGGTTTTQSLISGSYLEPTKTGYNFKGWCDGTITNQNTTPTCSGTTYTASTVPGVNSVVSSNTILSAMWQALRTVTITVDNSSYGSVSPTSVTAEQGSTITTSRKTLTIGSSTVTATPASGYAFDSWTNNCGTALTADCTITANFKAATSFDTAFADAGKSKTSGYYTMQDITSSICDAVTEDESTQLVDTRDYETYWVGKLADGKCWMLDNLRLGSTSTTALTSANTNIASNYTLPASTTTGFDSSTGYTTAAINTASKDKTTTSYGSGSGKIGTYYNYCAASAGTICSSSNSSNASYDICPKRWRMPTGGSSGEYNTLYTAYGSDASSFRSALSTPLSGYFYNGSAGGQGSYGYFWSSTRNNNTYMYHLYVYSSNVYPTNISSRYLGYSMRCVSQ